MYSHVRSGVMYGHAAPKFASWLHAVVSYRRNDGRFCVSNSIYARHVKRHGTKYCGAQCVVFGSVWINQGSM